MIKLSS